METLKTFSEIIVQDIPFSIIGNSLPGVKKKQKEGSSEDNSDSTSPPSAYQVLENPGTLNTFASGQADNALKKIQAKLREQRDKAFSNPKDYFSPSNIKKRITNYAKEEGKPLHVYLIKLFQLFLGLALFAFIASIFYKLFALIFLSVYLLVFVITFMIIHFIGYWFYKFISHRNKSEAGNLGNTIQNKLLFSNEDLGQGSSGGSDSKNRKNEWNNSIAEIKQVYDRLVPYLVTVYGFPMGENKVYTYGMDEDNINKYNSFNKGWSNMFFPTIQQTTFDDILGKDEKTVENKIKVINIEPIVSTILNLEASFKSYKALADKLDNVESGKVEQTGGAQPTSEANVKKQSKEAIINEMIDKIKELKIIKTKLEDIKKQTPDQVHYAELASNNYWKHIIRFAPIKFVIGIIQTYYYFIYSAKYVMKKLINVGTKITEVNNPLEESKKQKPLAKNGTDLLYKENAEGKIDTLIIIFTWLALLCSFMAKGYLAAAVILFIFAFVNGGAADIWKALIKTVLTELPPLLASMGIDLWNFTTKGIIDLVFGKARANIDRKEQLKKLNDKFGSGKADPDNTEAENKGRPGKPDKDAEGNLHDLYRENTDNFKFDYEKWESINKQLDDLPDVTTDAATKELDKISQQINEGPKMWFSHWKDKGEGKSNK